MKVAARVNRPIVTSATPMISISPPIPSIESNVILGNEGFATENSNHFCKPLKGRSEFSHGFSMAQGHCSLGCFIKIETRINAERRTIIEKAAARSLGLGKNRIGLGEREVRVGEGQEITSFRSQLRYILLAVGMLFEDDWQAISLGGFVEPFIFSRIGETALVAPGADGNFVAAGFLHCSRDVTTGRCERQLIVLD